MDVIKTSLNTVFIILAPLFLGIILIIIGKKERLAKGLIIAGFCLLCLLSFTPFSNFLLWDLESRYPPLMDLKGYTDIEYIVVLTAWDSDVPTIPYTSNLGYRSAFRTLEAHRIYKQLSHSQIIISGSATGGKLIRLFLTQLGVSESHIIIDPSGNTFDSVVNLKRVLKDRQFILVTSATHIPRAMSSFKMGGLDPVPAPADYLYGYYSNYSFPFPKPASYYIPNADALMRSSAALYEYLGTLYYYFKTNGFA